MLRILSGVLSVIERRGYVLRILSNGWRRQ